MLCPVHELLFSLIISLSKKCPQCATVVPIRLKVCKYAFRAKQKPEQNLPKRAMERLHVIMTDSAKSIVKVKYKLRKACK